MDNYLFPSVSSQYFSFGSHEEAILEANPMLTENKISFCEQLSEYGVPFQPSMYYQRGPPPSLLSKNTNLVNFPLLGVESLASSSHITQQPLSFSNKCSITQQVNDFETMRIHSRKRPVENSSDSEWTKKKVCNYGDKEKGNLIQVKDLDAREIPTTSVPVKRSQKLSDRITALQKLVSPYGKTDTTSVLQEASISIKLLQDQIQNLLGRNLSTSYINNKPLYMQESKEKQLGLCRRGLCLVPIALAHKLTKEELFK